MAVILYSNAVSFLFLCLALCLKKKQPEEPNMQPANESRSKITRMTSGDLNMSVKSFGKIGEENELDRRKKENRTTWPL